MRLVCLGLLALSLLVTAMPADAAEPPDYAIPEGHFFKQANGKGSAGDRGFAVYDDAAPFWSEFQQHGGVATLGYPISRRFLWDGFVSQAFQKAVLQWQPGRGTFFVNLFDRLSAAGQGDWLNAAHQTPPSFDHSADAGLAWEGVVARHLGLLDANPAIKARYLADADPVQHFGLPMSYRDYGDVFVVRAQRAVFQRWKVAVPWATAGAVVVANGGDIAKEAGALPVVAIVPQAPVYAVVGNLIAGPDRLHLWEKRWKDGGADWEPPRLLVSRRGIPTGADLGAAWLPFGADPPVEPSCLWHVTMDYATADTLYAGTCRGVYRWSGTQWQRFSDQMASWLAVAYGNPQSISAVDALGIIVQSGDGGQTWREGSPPRETGKVVAIDPRDPRTRYALTALKSWWFTLWRDSGGSGKWAELPLPLPAPAVNGMTLDGATGDIYLITEDHSSQLQRLWRTSNPNASDAAAVRWTLVHTFEPGTKAFLRASAGGSNGVVLYATLDATPWLETDGAWRGDQWSGYKNEIMVRSLDGGHTWQPLSV